jgi:7-carboxy-7-deazaguanine synthase
MAMFDRTKSDPSVISEPYGSAADQKLSVYRIYRSIQGESSYAGLPCALIRLAGCNLRCKWCDTPEAFSDGQPMTVSEILRSVESLGCELVEVTGGEPLLQEGARPLMQLLCEAQKTVLLETSGERDISGIDPRVFRIVDLKTPSSGESHRIRWKNLDVLTRKDEIKFVLADRDDYQWAREVISNQYLKTRVKEVLMSCVFGKLDPRNLVEWILSDGLAVRVQLQLHKYIWGGTAKDV